jgi:hypothetical protein
MAPAQKTDPTMPTRMPTVPRMESESKKNKQIPATTSDKKAQSSRRVGSPSMRGASMATYAEAAYWRTMALAAVVSLVATTKQIQNRPMQAPASNGLMPQEIFTSFLQSSMMTPPAIRLRHPAMAMGCRAISLMSTPLVLQRMAAANSISTARRFSFMVTKFYGSLKMVGLGSGQGRSDVETGGGAALRRGFQQSENAGLAERCHF